MALGDSFTYDWLSPSKSYNTIGFKKDSTSGLYSPFGLESVGYEKQIGQNAPSSDIFDWASAPDTFTYGADVATNTPGTTLYKTQYNGGYGYGLNDPSLPVETPAETPAETPSETPVVPAQTFEQPMATKSEVTVPHFEPSNVSLPVIDLSALDSELTNIINERATTPFSYTPEQLAYFWEPMEADFDISAKEAMGDFMEAMNRSGILESTVATDYGGRLLRDLEAERQKAYSTLAGEMIQYGEDATQNRINQAMTREADATNLETTKAQLEMQRAELQNAIERGNYSTGLEGAQLQLEVDNLNAQIDAMNSQLELSRGDSYRSDAELQLAVDRLGLDRTALADEIERLRQSQEFGQNTEKLQNLLSIWDRLYGQYSDETDRELAANYGIEELIQQILAGV